ncbi:polynucleotide kinase 3 phosphatase-domain-containing protein, partial [Gorgonomyces haynaldii]
MDNSIMYCCWGDFQPTNKIAAFDFDGTLANVKGSYSYPKDGDDFVLYHPSVLHVLEQLHKKGYTIIVFSNQGKIAEPSNHKRRDTFQGRVRHLHQKLTLHNNQIPVLVLAATGEDFCRKPRPGMWYWLHSKYNLDLQLHPDSFFVGDASGRHKGWMGKRTQDHSDFDRKYALNLNLPFYVPEQVFNDQVLQRFDQESHREWFVQVDELPPVDFDPKEYLGSGQDLSHLYQYDMIILVGSPASGKSTFCQKLPHVRVNQDQLKRKEKCIQYCREQLSQGKKVIIDNTNPTEKSRQEYLQLLGEGQTGIVVWIKTPMDVCFHNNKVR